MEAISADQLAWKPYPGQRSSTITYKSIFKGAQGAPDNFELSIVQIGEGGCYSPRHRHNFEQFRLPLNGPFHQSPRQDIPQHHLGYIAEGTYYGPQENEAGHQFLILQCAGPSGSGYMSQEELMQGTEELKQTGEFSGGVYRRTQKSDGERTNQDGYEAVWEHIKGRRIDYAKPRFQEPITIDPAAFPWQPVSGATGVAHRHLGTFNECGTGAGSLRLEPGARHTCAAERGRKLVVVLEGTVSWQGCDYPAWSGFHLAPGESTTFVGASTQPAVLLVLQIAQAAQVTR